MLENYEPVEGDRVLVDGLGPEGGRSGTVKFVDGIWRVWLDGIGYWDLGLVTVLQLLHREVPPRPVVESFTRSDGYQSRWVAERRWPDLYSVLTPEDADAFSKMYAQAAEQMRWDAEYGRSHEL